MALNVNLANTTAYAEVIATLVDSGGTIPALSQESGLALTTTRKFVAALKRRKLVRVQAWDKDSLGRTVIAVYEWGSAPDAKRPARQTMEERRARYYAKLQTLAILRGTSVKETRVRRL